MTCEAAAPLYAGVCGGVNVVDAAVRLGTLLMCGVELPCIRAGSLDWSAAIACDSCVVADDIDIDLAGLPGWADWLGDADISWP